jgi:hypothetical protein
VALAPPEFQDDSDRYEWEIAQRYGTMDTLDRWVAADGVYTIGPPLPPGAVVFTKKKATPAFKMATESGYIACRPAASELGISRKTVRKIIDRALEIRVAYVVYPGKKKNSRYHCRMIHKSSVRVIARDVPGWLRRVSDGGKKTTAENVRRGC